MPPHRRDTGEHLATALLYPDIKHVYVEGRTDARHLAVSAGYPAACDVHPVEEVDWDLDDEEEESSPFLAGYRRRVVAMAGLFNGKLRADNVRFLADKDHEDHHPIIRPNPLLVLTDFANPFVGELAFEWVRDAVFVATGARISDAFWANLIDGCRFLFSYRAIKQSRFPRSHLPAATNFVALEGGVPKLRKDLYCANGITSPHVNLSAKQLEQLVELDVLEKSGDQRHFINSEDFLVLLHSFIREGRLATNVSRDALKSAILVSMPRPSVNQPRLTVLLQWMNG